MNTSAEKPHFLFEVLEGKLIPKGKLSYFRARLSNKLHEAVLDLFEKREQEEKLTKAELARRIGRDPAQITRWFGTPGNLNTETVSDLLLGMGAELQLSIVDLAANNRVADSSNSKKVVAIGERKDSHASALDNQSSPIDSFKDNIGVERNYQCTDFSRNGLAHKAAAVA